MNLQLLAVPLLTALALSLTACSKPGEPPTSHAAAATAPAAVNTSSYDTVANTGRGFTVGSMMSAQPVYVLFEPQCTHCASLWKASLALHGKVKFIWMPVAFNQGKSLSQAATLLSAADPLAAMTEHEKLLLSGNGGITAIGSVSPELAKSIKTNTDLMTTLGIDSVPFILAKNRRTGEIVSNNGALDTASLAKLLGVD
ncbi:hypothetical protein [Rhodoferax antarcticus]|nr:hypothetical protein [Rhodoferax antarcticus]APW48406.1 hypothetical protein RA876_12035 [Rhodoferax antarcticus]